MGPLLTVMMTRTTSAIIIRTTPATEMTVTAGTGALKAVMMKDMLTALETFILATITRDAQALGAQLKLITLTLPHRAPAAR